MALTIATGMWGAALDRYGRNFLTSFDRFWPKETAIQVWTDRPFEEFLGSDMPARLTIHRMDQTNGWAEFIRRHKDDPRANGRAPQPNWKPSAKIRGYNFKFDAVRFAGQAFVPEAAAALLPDGDDLVWLDADVVTFSAVPAGWPGSLMRKHHDVAYLGRGLKHSEIGFWSIRLHPGSREFLRVFANLYREDRLFSLKEWHSAFVWDHARRGATSEGLIDPLDLTPGGSGHVWFQSPLKAHLDHLKGEIRKGIGHSAERRRA